MNCMTSSLVADTGTPQCSITQLFFCFVEQLEQCAVVVEVDEIVDFCVHVLLKVDVWSASDGPNIQFSWAT